MSNQELILEALNLPLSERLVFVNKLVESFNVMNKEVEENWKKELKDRAELLEIGKLDTVSYSEFFGES